MARKLSLVVNASIVVSALTLAVLLYLRFGLRGGPGIAQPGAKVPFTGVDWRANGQTLLVAVGPDCDECGQGAGFFRRLIDESVIRGVTVVVLAEPPAERARDLMAGLQLKPKHLFVVSFKQLQVKPVPSLILVDAAGTVVDVWQGALDASRQADVLAALQRRQGPS
jgi:hypothetical protein